jgi:hypothetical protein
LLPEPTVQASKLRPFHCVLVPQIAKARITFCRIHLTVNNRCRDQLCRNGLDGAGKSKASGRSIGTVPRPAGASEVES